MTNNITINRSASTIELTKKFDKFASRFGSEEYKALQEARRDYPTFRVVVKAAPKSNSNTLSGLTFKYMKDYIAKHDDAEGSIMAQFCELIGDTDEAREMGMKAECYGTVKKWFLETYPVFAEFAKKREAILSANKSDKAAA